MEIRKVLFDKEINICYNKIIKRKGDKKMDYKLYTLTDEELKKLKDLIYTEELKRKKEKKEELTKALKKAWKDIEEAGLNMIV